MRSGSKRLRAKLTHECIFARLKSFRCWRPIAAGATEIEPVLLDRVLYEQVRHDPDDPLVVAIRRAAGEALSRAVRIRPRYGFPAPRKAIQIAANREEHAILGVAVRPHDPTDDRREFTPTSVAVDTPPVVVESTQIPEAPRYVLLAPKRFCARAARSFHSSQEIEDRLAYEWRSCFALPTVRGHASVCGGSFSGDRLLLFAPLGKLRIQRLRTSVLQSSSSSTQPLPPQSPGQVISTSLPVRSSVTVIRPDPPHWGQGFFAIGSFRVARRAATILAFRSWPLPRRLGLGAV